MIIKRIAYSALVPMLMFGQVTPMSQQNLSLSALFDGYFNYGINRAVAGEDCPDGVDECIEVSGGGEENPTITPTDGGVGGGTGGGTSTESGGVASMEEFSPSSCLFEVDQIWKKDRDQCDEIQADEISQCSQP